MLPGANAKVLAYYLNSTLGRQWIASVVSQQVGQANVNGTKLGDLCFPLPPAVEQAVIVAMVEERLSALDATQNEIAHASARNSGTRGCAKRS